MKKLVLIDPYCTGYIHAHFSAAFIYSFLLAFPTAKVTFLSEKDHISWVMKYLTEKKIRHDNIDFQIISVPKYGIKSWKRILHEYRWVRLLFNTAEKQKAEKVIILKIFSSGLLMLKLFMYFRKMSFNVFAVFHGHLSTIAPEKSKLWNKILGLRSILRLPQPPRLKYIVLGDSIFKNVTKHWRELKNQFTPIEHPYFWFNDKERQFVPAQTAIRFGFFGTNRVGFREFENLAAEVMKNEYEQKIEFWLIGNTSRCFSSREFIPDSIKGVSFTPLTLEEYHKRASGITYSIWTSGAEHYRWSASASFLDSLSFVKPGFFLRNSYIEHCFEKMGDIGYMCDDIDGLKNEVVKVIKNFPGEKYEQQCENIVKGRKIFEPEIIAVKIRECLLS